MGKWEIWRNKSIPFDYHMLALLSILHVTVAHVWGTSEEETGRERGSRPARPWMAGSAARCMGQRSGAEPGVRGACRSHRVCFQLWDSEQAVHRTESQSPSSVKWDHNDICPSGLPGGCERELEFRIGAGTQQVLSQLQGKWILGSLGFGCTLGKWTYTGMQMDRKRDIFWGKNKRAEVIQIGVSNYSLSLALSKEGDQPQQMLLPTGGGQRRKDPL